MDNLPLESALGSLGRAAEDSAGSLQRAGRVLASSRNRMLRGGFSPIYLERWFSAHGGVVPLDVLPPAG